jgi:hypothetical protein
MPDESFKLLIDIQAKLTSAIKGLRGVRVEAEKAGAATDAVSKNMGVLEHAAATAAGVLIRDMVRGLAQTFTEAVSLGGRVETLQASFDALRKKAGSTELSLEELRKATRGMVSDVDLLQAANQAMSMHLPVDDLDKFYDAVIRVGKAQGLTATQAINDFTVAIGRQQPKILDNFGIILKQSEAYNEYARTLGKATDALTDSEKETAFSTVAIRKLMEQANILGDNISDVDLATDKFSATLTNLQTSVGSLLSPLGALAPILQGCIPIMTTISTITIPQLIAKYGLLGTATMAWGAITAATSKLVTASFLGIPIIGWIAAAAIAIGGIITLLGRWADSSNGLKRAQKDLTEAQKRHSEATQKHEQALNDLEMATTSLEAAQKREGEVLEELEEKTEALDRAQRNMAATLSWIRGEVESVDLVTDELSWSSDEARLTFEKLGMELQSLRDEFNATSDTVKVFRDQIGDLSLEQSKLRLEQLKLRDAFKDGEISQKAYEKANESLESQMRDLEIEEAELRLQLDETERSLDEQKTGIEEVEGKTKALAAADDTLEKATEDIAGAMSEATKRQEETARAMETLAEKERLAEEAAKDLKTALDALESKKVEVEIIYEEKHRREAERYAPEGFPGYPEEKEYIPQVLGQHGFEGVVEKPTWFLAGEAGPERVSISPGRRGASGGISIQGPLVQIMGSADRATAEYAARIIKDELRNVLVEASSSGAPATHKRIRLRGL